jgi:iron complex transport system substrate-binding protein
MAARPQKLIATLIVAIACASAGLARPSGPPFQPQAPAKRIISLVPALTEVLFAIGAGPQVIAVSSFDDDPPEVLKLPRVGALLDPDTERILSMRPDLVLTYGSQTDLDKQLAAAGIRTFSYRHGGLADVTPTFRTLGDLTGHRDEAARVANAIDARLAAIRSRVADRRRPRTLLVMGREPLSLRQLHASGGIGFLHDLVTLAGAVNVFSDVQRQAVHASTEMLIARAPDVILVHLYSRVLSQEAVEKERQTWRQLPSIPAVKAGRVHILLGDHLVVPGPRIAAAAEEIARAIHPEAFK